MHHTRSTSRPPLSMNCALHTPVYDKWLRFFEPYWDEKLHNLKRRIEDR